MSTLPMHSSLSVGQTPAALPWLWKWAVRWARPKSPGARDVTAEANQVRDLALQVRRHDPRFADDLFAAADRHERTHG